MLAAHNALRVALGRLAGINIFHTKPRLYAVLEKTFRADASYSSSRSGSICRISGPFWRGTGGTPPLSRRPPPGRPRELGYNHLHKPSDELRFEGELRQPVLSADEITSADEKQAPSPVSDALAFKVQGHPSCRCRESWQHGSIIRAENRDGEGKAQGDAQVLSFPSYFCHLIIYRCFE